MELDCTTRVYITSFQINLRSLRFDYSRWAIWSYLIFGCWFLFPILKQAPIYFDCFRVRCNAVLLRSSKNVFLWTTCMESIRQWQNFYFWASFVPPCQQDTNEELQSFVQILDFHSALSSNFRKKFKRCWCLKKLINDAIKTAKIAIGMSRNNEAI